MTSKNLPDTQNAHEFGEIPDYEGGHCHPEHGHKDKNSVSSQLRRAATVEEPTAPAHQTTTIDAFQGTSANWLM